MKKTKPQDLNRIPKDFSKELLDWPFLLIIVGEGK
jgi:hypothetical protein